MSIALQSKLHQLDEYLDSQKKSLAAYYKQEKYNLAHLVEKTVQLREKMKIIDQFLSEPTRNLKNAPSLLTILPELFKLGNAPLMYARMSRDMANFGAPAQDVSDELTFIWKKLQQMLPQFEQELNKTFTKRHARNVDAHAVNPSLEGNVTVRVLYHGLESIIKPTSATRKVMKSPKGFRIVIEHIEKSGLTPDRYFDSMTNMLTDGVVKMLANFPDIFTRVYGPKLRLNLMIFVYPMEDRGVVAFFTRRFWRRGSVIANINIEGRIMQVWFSFQMLSELFMNGPQQGAHAISSILAHELTHAFDKQYEQKGDLFDHIRMEGLATFAAAIRQPTILTNDLANLQGELRRWLTIRELVEDCSEKRRLPYTIGLVMCLGLLFYRIKKRHRQILTPYTSTMEIIAAFKNQALRDDILNTFRLINSMKKREFFRAYRRAVEEGVAPELFSNDIYDAAM